MVAKHKLLSLEVLLNASEDQSGFDVSLPLLREERVVYSFL